MTTPVVIVTGAADGIGWATAQLFAARGWRVALLDMDGNKAKERAQTLGPQHVGVTCDVTDEAQASAAITHTVAQLGRLDALVNNAGIGDQTAPTLQQTAQAFDRVLSVHLRGAFLMTQAALSHMQAQDRDAKGNRGAIVNIASVVAVAGQPGYLHYVASKGAVLAMTKGLAKECGAANVRVNVIAPGFVITDATKNRPIEWQQSFLKARAISREQRPDDLVGTAMYLMSDLSAFVSGQTIVVDGGHIMY